MRCKCGSNHKVRRHFKDKQYYCQECYDEIMQCTRELEDFYSDFTEDLGDTSNVPHLQPQ
jgi:hypothetical protein